MKMITLFLPERYIEYVDALVSGGLYPNRSEALRTGTWRLIMESVKLLKVYNDHAHQAAGIASQKSGKAPAEPFEDVLTGLEMLDDADIERAIDAIPSP